jgi:hypothetical protein
LIGHKVADVCLFGADGFEPVMGIVSCQNVPWLRTQLMPAGMGSCAWQNNMHGRGGGAQHMR